MEAGPHDMERVYREHGPRLWRALLAFTGDPEVADDAMAEAFVQAIARGDGIRLPEDWVWTAAFKIARGMVGRPAEPRIHERREPYELPGPVDHLVEALSRISPKQRIAVVLHDYADRPVHEIASVIGASSATVYVHLSAGRRRLRTLLEGSDA